MLTMKDIILEGHPTLRMKAERVEFPMDPKLKETALAMMEFLRNSQDEELAEKYGLRAGVGIAAPQINISKQIFAMLLYRYNDEGEVIGEEFSEIFVNPKIRRHSVVQAALKTGEGCLSVDREVPGFVPRPKTCTIDYQDLEGQVKSVKLRDYPAIVAQHEIDHLNGIMFYDHIDADHPWKQVDGLVLI